MNLTYFTAPSFKKKQIATTAGNERHEGQRFVVMRQSRLVGTARRAVQQRCLPGRSPRRGDPTLPGYVVNDPFFSVNFVSFCSKFLFLAGALLFLGLATSVQAQFDYTTNNGAITITGYTGSGGAVTIPSMIDGLAVSDIGTNAFEESALTSVTIPDSVTNIGDYGFYGCDGLTNVDFGSGLVSIGAYAFSADSYPCLLPSITIPDSVIIIGDYAFYDCHALTNVTFGDSVISIGNYAFSGFVYGPPTHYPLYPSGAPLTTVTIPSSVTNIGVGAFEACASLTNATFGVGLTTIGAYAFEDCGLTNAVTIPDSVTNIGVLAFEDCGNLTAINVASNNPAYTSIGGVLFNKSATTLLQFPGGVVGYSIPSGVTDIQSNAFYDCPSLTSVTIPNSVISIGDYAFFECQALTNVTMAEGLASIGAYAFSGRIGVGVDAPGSPPLAPSACPLTSITIPSGVTNIGTGAFAGCHWLTNVTIPNSVTSIGDYLFEDCWVMTGVTIPNSVTNIGDGAFSECDLLTNITIPGSVLTIGAGAFLLCTDLTEVTISLGVTDIGSNAFAGTDLSSVVIPDSVTSIGAYAFSGLGLTTIAIPDSVTNLGDYAFAGCDILTSAYFLGNAPSADTTVFFNDHLKAYYLPGTTGWANFTANTGVPTALWTLPYPLILNGSFGVLNNQFGFTISWAANVPVVVEASTDLSNGVWTPIATNTLTGGASYFSDPQWTNYPARFYRIRSQ